MASTAEILAGRGTTLIAHNHLQQIVGFIRGGGVEFLPRFDRDALRRSFLEQLVRENYIRRQINSMATHLLTQGRCLLYLRPIPGSYRIHWYRADQYQLDYDRYGDVQAATIVYGYQRRDETGQARDRWVRIRLTADVVQTVESHAKLDFSPQTTGMVPEIGPNRLGYVPVVECLNPTPGSETDGVSDFAALTAQIEAHDEMTEAIVDAIIFYCQSPILTSRDASEISETGAGGVIDQTSPSWPGHQSVSYASGFRPVGASMPVKSRRKLKRVIGSIDPTDDTFQQLAVAGVSGELVNYATDYERQLREAMGGLLERGIETAQETRVVYGKVQATARDKQVALFENGLCKIFEMAILAEEALYVASAGTHGLPPIGDRQVLYRVAPIFLESTNETLQKSIVSRNLMRQGVNAKQALQFVFPDKSENELDVMVGSGGLPTEYLEAAMRIMSQLSTMQALDPVTGIQSPVADPLTGEPLYKTLLPFITQSLDYGSQFTATSSVNGPANDRRTASAVNAARDGILREYDQQFAIAGGPPTDPSERLPDPGVVTRSPEFFDWQQSPIANAVSSAARTVGSWFGR